MYCNRNVIGKKGGKLFVNPTMILMSVGVVCPLQFSLVGQMKGELKSLEVEEEEEEEEEKKKSAASQAKKPARCGLVPRLDEESGNETYVGLSNPIISSIPRPPPIVLPFSPSSLLPASVFS